MLTCIISNWPCASHSSNFEITHAITQSNYNITNKILILTIGYGSLLWCNVSKTCTIHVSVKSTKY